MGVILTTFPITISLAAVGHRMTLLQLGAAFALIGVLAALGLKRPPTATAVTPDAAETFTAEMLRTPVFWLIL
jgi:OFA family oxalate/formate antiporter-like MFS transporter